MARHRNPLVRALTTGFVLAFIAISGRLPLSFNRWLALRLGRALARLVPRVRRVAMDNLDLAYGESLSKAEKAEIFRGAVDNIALIAAEFAHLPRLAGNRSGFHVEVVGFEYITACHGCLIIGAHLGNRELLAPYAALNGLDNVVEVVRPFDDPRMDRAIDRIRRTGGVVTLSKDNAGKEIIRQLRDGAHIGVLIDQSPRESAVPVTFFGAPCWATIAPVMIAVRAKVPIVPVSVARGADFSYTITFHPPIEMARTKNLRDDLVRNSQRCQDAIESIVRAHPEQWLWLHRRWKERPRLAEEWDRKSARSAPRAESGTEEGIA